ncbi:MAG: DUF881 domain-containing protein [Actinomycetota bacterium]
MLPAILMVLGFLVAAAVGREQVREERFPRQVAELVDLIDARRRAISELSGEAEGLNRRLDELRAAAGTGSAELRTTLDRIERLRARAGLARAQGGGLVIEVADSEDAPTTRDEVTDFRIQDVDLREIVNALWRAGAEAIAINGQRVVVTTAIREAGGTILVNFSPVTSPYRVSAVGDPTEMRVRLDQSGLTSQFDVWEQVYGLGFAIRSVSELTLPGLQTELSWASPA